MLSCWRTGVGDADERTADHLVKNRGTAVLYLRAMQAMPGGTLILIGSTKTATTTCTNGKNSFEIKNLL